MIDQEYERRFLVSDPDVLHGTSYEVIDQGYLWSKGGYAMRVRRNWSGDPFDPPESDAPGVFALKGPRKDWHRFELEFLIPAEHLNHLLKASNHRILKRRHMLIYQRDVWSVDVFLGDNEGLVIAEFEGSAATVASIKKPAWCSVEVTDRSEYDNENLAKRPYRTWRPDTIR